MTLYNLHYGSKADLYALYVVEHLEGAMGRMPRLSDNLEDLEGQLRRLVAWFFERFRPDSPLRRLNQDMNAMKGDFAETIMETVIRPEFQNCREFVVALLPGGAPEEKIRNWVKSIISLCTGPLHSSHLYPSLFPGVSFDDSEIDRQAEHVTQLILDGLAASAVGIVNDSR